MVTMSVDGEVKQRGSRRVGRDTLHICHVCAHVCIVSVSVPVCRTARCEMSDLLDSLPRILSLMYYRLPLRCPNLSTGGSWQRGNAKVRSTSECSGCSGRLWLKRQCRRTNDAPMAHPGAFLGTTQLTELWPANRTPYHEVPLKKKQPDREIDPSTLPFPSPPLCSPLSPPPPCLSADLFTRFQLGAISVPGSDTTWKTGVGSNGF